MFKHYLTSALRHFWKHKTTTIINVLCLSLGLTCFAVAYGLTQYYSHGDLYHEKASRTFVLTERNGYIDASTSVPELPTSGWGIAQYLQTDYPQLEIVARAIRGGETAIATSGTKDFAVVAYADAGFLEIFDLPFIAGDRRAALQTPHSAVISNELAKRLFGSTDVVGKTLLLSNRETVTITGVMTAPRQPSHIAFHGALPALQFSLLASMDTWDALLSATEPTAATSRVRYFQTNAFTYLVFPKDSSLTPDQLRGDLARFSAAIIPQQQGHAILGIRPVSEIYEMMSDIAMQSDKTGVSSTAFTLLLGTLVLVAACLSYANLASAQATTRLKEMALRRVVGASRRQIALQSFCEALLLVTVAACLSLATLPVIVNAVKAGMGLEIGSLLFGATSFWIVMLIMLTAVALLACSYPALVAARIRPAHALQSGRVPLTKRRTMHILVVLQFAAASFLFVATSVMNAQNQKMRPAALKPSDDPIVVIGNNLKYAGVDVQLLQNELRRQPAVKSVSAIDVAPGELLGRSSAIVQTGVEPSSRRWIVGTPAIDYDFFATMGVKLLAGREFDRSIAADVATAYGVGNVVIDHVAALEYGWHTSQEAIGKSIYLPSSPGAKDAVGLPRTVIGVVENKMLYPVALVGSTSTVYSVAPTRVSALVVRVAKEDVAGGVRAIDNVWNQLAPNVALKRRFFDEQFDAAYKQVTSMTAMFRFLAFFSMLVGVMGLVGIATHAMSQRQFEIGVRRTLGATARQVLVMLLMDFSKPILIANLIAWPLAYVIAKAYTSFFADKAPLTIVPFAASLLLGLVIAWLAVLKQATRAASMNPATALRYE